MSERYYPSDLPYNLLKAEIEEIRRQIGQIDKELSSLGFCWFGEKRRHKNALKKRRANLKQQLYGLYDCVKKKTYLVDEEPDIWNDPNILVNDREKGNPYLENRKE